jgi:hypothetical protein
MAEEMGSELSTLFVDRMPPLAAKELLFISKDNPY